MSKVLNAFELKLNKNSIVIYRVEFDYDLLKSLREKYNDYSFLRHSSYIYAWKIYETDSILPSGFAEETIYLCDDARIFSTIVEQSIYSYLQSKKYNIYRLSHSNIFEFEMTKKKPTIVENLRLLHCQRFSVNYCYCSSSDENYLMMTYTDKIKLRFNVNEEELKKRNIDTRGWDRNSSGNITTSKKNVKKYLDIINKNVDYDRAMSNFYVNTELFKNLQLGYEIYNRNIYNNIYLPDGLKITESNLVSLPNSRIGIEEINKPTFYYYNSKMNNSRSYIQERVKQSQPFSFDMFKYKKIRVLALSYLEYQGSFEIFIDAYKNILTEYFHLNVNDVDLIQVDRKQESYLNKLDGIDLSEYDIAVAVLSEKDKMQDVSSSEYYSLKAKLLTNKLPSQIVLIERIRSLNPFYMNNITLNSYAKLGGFAWTIEKDKTVKNELIVGIGSSVNRKKQTAIGFANVFDYDGKYILGDCSQLASKENYSDELSKHLKKIIRDAIDQKSIDKGSEIKLFFHLYKEAGKNSEIRAITLALQEFKEYKIQFCAVHLSYNHNYKLFNNKGNSIFENGIFMQLDDNIGLVSLGNKSGVPLQVRVDNRSSFKDIFYISKQIVHFMYISHTSYKPSTKPITMLYPYKMTELANQMRLLPNWDSSIISQMTDKLWFI